MLCTVKLFVWWKLCVCWSALSSWGQQELDRDKPPFFYHLLCCFYQLPKWISVRISWISPGQHKRIFILSFWGCFWAFHLRALYEVLFFTPRAQWISKEWIFNVIYRFVFHILNFCARHSPLHLKTWLCTVVLCSSCNVLTPTAPNWPLVFALEMLVKDKWPWIGRALGMQAGWESPTSLWSWTHGPPHPHPVRFLFMLLGVLCTHCGTATFGDRNWGWYLPHAHMGVWLGSAAHGPCAQ